MLKLYHKLLFFSIRLTVFNKRNVLYYHRFLNLPYNVYVKEHEVMIYYIVDTAYMREVTFASRTLFQETRDVSLPLMVRSRPVSLVEPE